MKYILSFCIIIIFITVFSDIKTDYINIDPINDSIIDTIKVIISEKGMMFNENNVSIIINTEKQTIFILNNKMKTYQVLPIEELQNLIKMFSNFNVKDSSSIEIKKIREMDDSRLYYIYKNNDKIYEIENNENIDIQKYEKNIKILKNVFKTLPEMKNNIFNFLDNGIPKKIISFENNKKTLITKLIETKTGDFSYFLIPPKNYNEE